MYAFNKICRILFHADHAIFYKPSQAHDTSIVPSRSQEKYHHIDQGIWGMSTPSRTGKSGNALSATIQLCIKTVQQK